MKAQLETNTTKVKEIGNTKLYVGESLRPKVFRKLIGPTGKPFTDGPKYYPAVVDSDNHNRIVGFCPVAKATEHAAESIARQMVANYHA